jgi:hypothetical protein
MFIKCLPQGLSGKFEYALWRYRRGGFKFGQHLLLKIGQHRAFIGRAVISNRAIG